jgi:hypothetical protein
VEKADHDHVHERVHVNVDVDVIVRVLVVGCCVGLNTSLSPYGSFGGFAPNEGPLLNDNMLV